MFSPCPSKRGREKKGLEGEEEEVVVAVGSEVGWRPLEGGKEGRGEERGRMRERERERERERKHTTC